MEVPGRYERMRVLGRGSFGAVTLVKDNRDSKLYAMKTLNCAEKLEERGTAMAEVWNFPKVVRLASARQYPDVLFTSIWRKGTMGNISVAAVGAEEQLRDLHRAR